MRARICAWWPRAGWTRYYEHGLNVWDWAAGALIAAEAGAQVTLPPSAKAARVC